MFISSLSILFNKGKEHWKKHSPKALIEYTQNSARIQTMSLKQREKASVFIVEVKDVDTGAYVWVFYLI